MIVYVVRRIVKSDRGVNSSENIIAFSSEERAIEYREVLYSKNENRDFDIEVKIEPLVVV